MFSAQKNMFRTLPNAPDLVKRAPEGAHRSVIERRSISVSSGDRVSDLEMSTMTLDTAVKRSR